MADPTHITTDQLRAAYDALGLDADGWNRTMRFELRPDFVILVRYRPGENGRPYVENDEIVTDPVAIPVRWAPEPAHDKAPEDGAR